MTRGKKTIVRGVMRYFTEDVQHQQRIHNPSPHLFTALTTATLPNTDVKPSDSSPTLTPTTCHPALNDSAQIWLTCTFKGSK